MLKLKLLCFLSVMMILSACDSNNIKDEDSTFYAVPAGSLLVLNQQITIAGNQVAVYVQNGELLSYKEVDKYQPNCKFEVYKISDQPRTVQAGTFEIIRVVDDIESSLLQTPTQLAFFSNVAGQKHSAGWILDHGYMFNYATFMYLSSAKQKDVYRMTCQHWESVTDDRHLSISQMRSAMGEVFTLKISDKEKRQSR